MGGALQVHVLNSGYGESIVVGLPDGAWGLVDCYSSSLAQPHLNPTLAFLQDKEVTELEFLCLTHPHDDHYRGMSHILENLDVKRFWRFGGFHSTQLRKLLAYAQVRAAVTTPTLTETAKAEAGELSRIFQLVHERMTTDKLHVERMEGFKCLHAGRGPTAEFRIDSIAPSGDDCYEYECRLNRCLDAQYHYDAKQAAQLNDNRLSGALLIEYGAATVMLGGDVECSGWERVLCDCERLGYALASVLVKVSHHGSPTGYCEGLWSQLTGGVKTIAVIAPSLKHNLPKYSALRHIAEHAHSTYATCDVPISLDDNDHYQIGSAYRGAAEMLIRAQFLSFRSEPGGGCGICSVLVEEDGHCRVTCTGGACKLALDS